MKIVIDMSVGMLCTLAAIVVIVFIVLYLYNKRGTTSYHPIIIGSSLIALTISIVTVLYLFFGEFTSAECCFNYSDTSVSVLSVLVTVLIGWNIWTVIDIKKTVKEIKAKTNRIQEETMARAYTSIMNQTAYIVEGRSENDDCYNAISNGLFACKHFHLAGNTEECKKLLKIISNFKKENCKLNSTNLQNLWMIIGQMKGENIEVSMMEKWLNAYSKEVD